MKSRSFLLNKLKRHEEKEGEGANRSFFGDKSVTEEDIASPHASRPRQCGTG